MISKYPIINRSVLLLSCLVITSCGGGSTNATPDAVIDSGTIFSLNFENNDVGAYSTSALLRDWGTASSIEGVADGKASIIIDPIQGKTLRIKYPTGLSNTGKSQWKLNLGKNYDELYVSYRLKFNDDFDFVKGGKLPGLAGGTANAGGVKPNGYDGWSARMMWRDAGRLVQYVYHPDQPKDTGEDLDWGFYATPGNWYQVETRVKMNTPKLHDGIIESWVNGVKVLTRTNLRFRDISDLGIDIFYFSTFFGGSDPSWAPLKDEYAYFDDFIISEKPVTH